MQQGQEEYELEGLRLDDRKEPSKLENDMH